MAKTYSDTFAFVVVGGLGADGEEHCEEGERRHRRYRRHDRDGENLGGKYRVTILAVRSLPLTLF